MEKNGSELYVLRKTNTNRLYLQEKRTTTKINWARKFNCAVKAIDFMIDRKLIDDFDLVKIGDL